MGRILGLDAMALTRRGFLFGLAAAAATPALPPVSTPIGGTITGRFTGLEPAFQELTRRQTKALAYAHAYGAGPATMRKIVDVSHVDFAEIERRLFARHNFGVGDPFDVRAPV